MEAEGAVVVSQSVRRSGAFFAVVRGILIQAHRAGESGASRTHSTVPHAGPGFWEWWAGVHLGASDVGGVAKAGRLSFGARNDVHGRMPRTARRMRAHPIRGRHTHLEVQGNHAFQRLRGERRGSPSLKGICNTAQGCRAASEATLGRKAKSVRCGSQNDFLQSLGFNGAHECRFGGVCVEPVALWREERNGFRWSWRGGYHRPWAPTNFAFAQGKNRFGVTVFPT